MKSLNGSKTKRALLKNVITFIITFHLVIFTSVIIQQSFGRPNFAGKAYMNSAMLINTIYILPLSKAFGSKNFSTAPFYFLRDSLYRIGWNILPTDDAEREMFWFAIRYKEFDELFISELSEYRKGTYHLDPTTFDHWTVELHEHLKPLATKPLQDTFFRKKRLEIFNLVASWYVLCREAYINTRDIDAGKWRFVYNDHEIKKVKELLNHFNILKEYCKKHETTAYNKMIQRTDDSWILDPIFTNDAATMIVANMLTKQKSGHFDCNDQYLKFYSNTRQFLLEDALITPKVSQGMKDLIKRNFSRPLHKEVIRLVNKLCH